VRPGCGRAGQQTEAHTWGCSFFYKKKKKEKKKKRKKEKSS